jgi:hypothetical protein
MATMADARGWINRHRVQSEALGVAVLGLVVFTALGLRARQQGEPLRAELAKLQAASAEVSTFRASFTASTPEQDSRITQLSDSLSIAVVRDQRVGLAQRIAAEADAVGLSDVRVRFAAPDSAAAPVRPDLVRNPVSVADYSIAVECYGSFATVLSLVNRLPASVALQRVVGTNINGRARFQIVLAVFEASPAATIGAVGGEVVSR